MIRVLLVTDVRVLRDGLVHVLAESDAVTVVGSAATCDEAVEAARSLDPAVVLLDISVLRCVEIGRAVRAACPLVSIVAFAADADDAEHLACIEAGITGFVPRDGGMQELVAAVVSVARGEPVCSPRVVAATFQRLAALAAEHGNGGGPPLSARETQIVELIDHGLSNKEIARRLEIGLATVKNHVHHILEKLGVTRRGEAAAQLRGVTAGRGAAPLGGTPAARVAHPGAAVAWERPAAR